MHFIESVSLPAPAEDFIVIWIINNRAASSITGFCYRNPSSDCEAVHFYLISAAQWIAQWSFFRGDLYWGFHRAIIHGGVFWLSQRGGNNLKKKWCKLNCQSQNMQRNLSSRWKWQWTVCLVKLVQTPGKHCCLVSWGCLSVFINFFFFF